MRDFSDVSRRLQEEAKRRQVGTGADQGKPSRLITSLQSQIDAIERGDYDTVLSHAHADVTLDIFAPPEFAWICQTRGVAELRRALEQNFGSVDDQTPTITQIFTEGETVVLFGREQGRIRATGQQYDVEFVERFTFRDERLTSIRIILAHCARGGKRYVVSGFSRTE